MKQSLLILCTCVLVAYQFMFTAGTSSVTQSEENPMEADEWMFYQKAYPYNTIDFQAQQEAVQHTIQLRNANRAGTRSSDDWIFIGPTTIGGRIQDVEMPAGSFTTVYAGSASGGVLRSYNFGETWEMIFDENESLSIGDIAIDPADTSVIFVGTGEPNVGGGSLTYDGHGIYKSVDGGNSWENIGLTEMGSTGRLAINPENTNIVFAAMMGNLFENNAHRGLYRTEDGGASWENVLFVSDSTGAVDVVINPENPDIVYAATWERVRRFNRRDIAGVTSGIYKSTDGGDTWTKLTTGLPSGQLSRITLSLCNAAPEVLYACIVGSDESVLDIYKTTDGGDNWTDLNASGDINSVSFDYWFGGIKVDPANADNVFYIGFTPSKSTDGGLSWNDFAGAAHVDNHALFISPENSDIKILGNDGGLYFTTNNFSTYTTDQNIPVTQIYDFDVFDTDTSFILAGAQDNGSFIKSSGTDDWFFANGGDGVSNVFLQTDDESYFANYQYGGYYGLVDGVDVPLSGKPSDRWIWRSPLETNPLNPYTIYFGGTKVYRTLNGGYSLNTISSDLTNGPGMSPIVFGCISTLHNASADTNYMYAGCDDGNVWRSKNYGVDWEKISETLPMRFCTSIQTDPTDAETVYITFSGYRWADDVAHVYRSVDAGDTWVSLEGDLPDIPVNDIAVFKTAADSTFLYVANDAGVYVSYNEGVNWSLPGSAMPVVSVSDLEINTETNTLFAGTYGRGIYKIQIAEQTPVSITEFDLKFTVFPNPVNDILFIQTNRVLEDADIFVFDISGKLILQKKCNGTSQEFSLKHLQKGNYFVKVNAGDTVMVKKITKA